MATSSKSSGSRSSRSSSRPTSKEQTSVFPPGFERDTKALLMLREWGVLTRAEVRENIQRLNVELHPDPEYQVPALRYLYEEDDELEYENELPEEE